MTDGTPTAEVKKAPAKHRIVSVVRKRKCVYTFIWDDGYKADYSAAVQCGYADRSEGCIALVNGGELVQFPDNTTMSAELLRVDTMQRLNHIVVIMLCFAMVLTIGVLALLYWGAFAEQFLPVAWGCVAVLTSVTLAVFYRNGLQAFTFLGAALSMIGLVLVPQQLITAAWFLGAGYMVHFINLAYFDRRVSIGLES